MTSTVKVTAHCGADKEVCFGISSIPVSGVLTEVSTLQDGETVEKHIYEGRVAVVLERIKE